ncbi:MAG: hypothetical protein ACPGVB_01360 [Chitinophagales bacterium]
MQTIPINSKFQLDVQVVLEGINHLDTLSLEHFAEKVNTLVAKRKAVSLSEQETILLKQINKGIAPNISNRFNELQQKQRTSKLNNKEQDELNTLVDNIELQEAKRLEAMITLAQIWNISLEELRNKLQIKPNEPYVW